jgi:hypothetical protein
VISATRPTGAQLGIERSGTSVTVTVIARLTPLG